LTAEVNNRGVNGRRSEMVATYELQEVILMNQPVVSIREITTLANLGAALAEVYLRVGEYLKERGVEPCGPPFARFYSVEESRVDVDAGFPVEMEVPRRWRIRCSHLPGGPALTLWHTGPYDRMASAYDAIDGWLKNHGRVPNGAPWEVFYTDPEEVPNPAEWRTQIIQPMLPLR
jgi:effector-binding domain-containing protein